MEGLTRTREALDAETAKAAQLNRDLTSARERVGTLRTELDACLRSVSEAQEQLQSQTALKEQVTARVALLRAETRDLDASIESLTSTRALTVKAKDDVLAAIAKEEAAVAAAKERLAVVAQVGNPHYGVCECVLCCYWRCGSRRATWASELLFGLRVCPRVRLRLRMRTGVGFSGSAVSMVMLE